VTPSLPPGESPEELPLRARREVKATTDEAELIVERHPRFSAGLRVVSSVLREQSW
jgi:hypothetical protein